jgi:hypothetical protein
MDFTPDQLGQALEAANSTPEFVGETLADFTRKLMGASVSSSPHCQTSEATTLLLTALRHMKDFDGSTLRKAMQIAEESLRVEEANDPLVQVAQTGTRYLIARSSTDAFSSARSSKARSALRESVHWAVKG